MIKMTYTEAATCGMNLKVRVTPDKSEKMQLAWFAAGKTWQGGRSIVTETGMEYLYLDETLSFGHDFIESFNNNEAEEIELIDDTPQPNFASQQEVCLWVAQGNQVKSKDDIVAFKNGMLVFLKSGHVYQWNFEDYQNWQKHTPKW